MIKVIRSGMQSGSDLAGAKVGKLFSIQTTGAMPKGWRTLDGPKPEYKDLYNAYEMTTSGYKERTWENVEKSDGTIRIAYDFNSPGEKCTKNAIIHYQKPFIDVRIHEDHSWSLMIKEVSNFVRFLYLNDIYILNVAGNSEKTAPGIEKTASFFLEYTLEKLGHARQKLN